MALVKKISQSMSITDTKAEPMSWFMDSPVTTAYSGNFLNLAFSTFFFSVTSAVKILPSSTGNCL